MVGVADAIEDSGPSSAPSLSEKDFTRFRDYFYRKTGIWFNESKRYFVDKRILARMKIVKKETFRSYFTYMRFQVSGEELRCLVESMTVNESYFFREEYQFKCMVHSLLNEIVEYKRPGEAIRIWSLPCSTGEEPYSIALYLLEYWPGINEFDVEIVASDIDSQAMARAQKGIYTTSDVRQLPPTLLAKYFTRQGPKNYQIIEDIRSCVTFSEVNLSSRLDVKRFRAFDLIFCRNLLIYFDDAMRRQAAGSMYDALNPGGFVCLGHSESMSRISSLFEPRKFTEAMVHQKSFDAARMP